MTREEFIDGFTSRSKLEQYRTPTGYKIGSREYLALACACGNDLCEGWAMVNAAEVDTHEQLYAPRK